MNNSVCARMCGILGVPSVQSSHIPCVFYGSAAGMLLLTTVWLFHNNSSFCKAAVMLYSEFARPREIGGGCKLGDVVITTELVGR